MAGKDVISMEELRQQLGEAIPTAAQDVAKAWLSVADMNKAIASGSVESKTALARFFAVRTSDDVMSQHSVNLKNRLEQHHRRGSSH